MTDITKARLPIRTKVTIWWLFIMGIVVPIAWILSYLIGSNSLDYLSLLFLQSPWGFAILLVSISCLPPAILLLRKAKSDWKEAVIILSIEIICFLSIGLPYLARLDNYDQFVFSQHFPYIFVSIPLLLLSYLIPLILLILDRKNYFEMVRQRELAKKNSEAGQGEGQ